MMNRLIDNIRELNALLQRTAGQAVSFHEMADVLGRLLDADCRVFSRKGKLLGYGPDASAAFASGLDGNRLPAEWNRLLLSVRSAEVRPGPAAGDVLRDLLQGGKALIVPIVGGKERAGTLLFVRDGQAFDEADMVLAEYGATIIGMEIMRGQVDEIELEARTLAAVQGAVASLSFSELEAVEHILQEMDSPEGLLVASKIADRAGITRSVIVNALRKLECAGILEARSLGMKGTYIKILNDKIFGEIGAAKVKTNA